MPQEDQRALLHTTLIGPIMEYASVVWDPFTEENIRKLEMVQRRAVCMVYADYRLTSSVTNMLQQLQWSTLQENRAQAKVIMVCQIVYSFVDLFFFLLITLNQSYLTIISEDSLMLEESPSSSSCIGIGKYPVKPPQLGENCQSFTHTKSSYLPAG